MSRFWDWQLGLRHITNNLQQRNVIPPRFKQNYRFEEKVTKDFCRTKNFKGSFSERIMFICYKDNNWREFCQWTRSLRQMPEFKVGDRLNFEDGVEVEVIEANPLEEPKVITLLPVDPEVNLGQGKGKFQIYKVKNVPTIIRHIRPEEIDKAFKNPKL